jgi:hypothetical protein
MVTQHLYLILIYAVLLHVLATEHGHLLALCITLQQTIQHVCTQNKRWDSRIVPWSTVKGKGKVIPLQAWSGPEGG